METKRVVSIGIAMLAMGIVAGCTAQKNLFGEGVLPHEAGWQNYPTARTFDFPGTLFAVDDKGVWRSVGSVKTGYASVGHEAIPDTSERRQTTAALALKLLGIDANKVSADLNQQVTLTVKLPDGFDRYRLRPANRQKEIIPDAINQIGMPQHGWKYFLVEETKAAKKFDIALVSSAGSSANFSAVVKQAVSAGGNLVDNGGTTATFQRTFDEDYNVLFLASEIVFPENLGAFPTIEDVKLRMVNEPIQFEAVAGKR